MALPVAVTRIRHPPVHLFLKTQKTVQGRTLRTVEARTDNQKPQFAFP